MPTISVLMSIYNEKESEINESIESILNQTYSDFELILVIDNPDNLSLINFVRKYQNEDKRVKIIINNENIGLAESMNKAAFIAKGEYFLRMDADDISHPTRFEKQIKIIMEGNFDLVCSSYYFIDESGKILDYEVEWFDSISIKKLLVLRNVIHHPTVIMKAQSFRKVEGYRNFQCAQDYDLWLRMAKENFKFYMIEEELLYYRIRPSSITTKHKYKQSTTLKYIRKIHSKSDKSKYNYTDYMNFLLIRKVDNQQVVDDYLKNMKLYTEAKSNIKSLRLMEGAKKFAKVFFISKHYRPQLISACKFLFFKNLYKFRYKLKKV